jgi:putative selenium metabolism protein SsnA
MDDLLVHDGTVVTLGAVNRVLKGHSVLCSGGRIRRIAEASSFETRGLRVLDASGKIVMPGFINAHMHFYSTMVRGLGKMRPSKTFAEVLENLWWRLDRKLSLDDSYFSALVVLLEAVKHGTTTLIDHHAGSFAPRGSLDRIADAVLEAGVRASLCYEVSDRDGPKAAQDGLDENEAFIRRCRSQGHERLKALFGLHAAFTIGDETLRRASRIGRELGAGFHLHAAEGQADEDISLSRHGMRTVERLDRFGILGPKTIAAHCVHVDEREMDLLKESGTAVAHCPQSNMNNAVGIADIVKMRGKGILVGLGTDAMTVDMKEEVRAALWAQRLLRKDPCAAFQESVSALLSNNALIANRYFEPKVGALEEGWAADMAVIDYRPCTPFDEESFPGHFVFGITQSPVDSTIVAGRVLMERKELQLGIDEAKVAAESSALAAKLWERF